jgi:peptidoglycan/LPS O-acetylase OafA/YrhL
MPVEPVVAPPPGNPRFPLVDSLRGISCLLVIFAHVSHVSGAYRTQWFGRYAEHMLWVVTMFFMISAFLLYRPFVAARLDDTATAPAIADYGWRRALRVLPGYWVALTVLWLTLGLPEMSHWWPRYYTLTQVYGSERLLLGGDTPAWTLSCEIVFYLALPLIVLTMRRVAVGASREQRYHSELRMVATLIAVGVAFRLLFPDLAQTSLNRTLLATLDWFALGMGLAVVSAHLAHRPRQPGWVRWIRREPMLAWLAAFLCFLIASAFHGGSDFFATNSRASAGEDLLTHVLYGATALGLMLPAVFGHTAGGFPRRVLALPALKWLGMVAYGVYLYHFPILLKLWRESGSHTDGSRWLSLLVPTVAISIAAGAASYYLVERPILRYKDVRLRLASGHRPASPTANRG